VLMGGSTKRTALESDPFLLLEGVKARARIVIHVCAPMTRLRHVRKKCTKSIVSGCCLSDLPPLDHARPGRPSRRARAGSSSAGRRHSTEDALSSLAHRASAWDRLFLTTPKSGLDKFAVRTNLLFSRRPMHFLGHLTGQKFYNRSNEISCAAPV
jgi:hypothetical protein